MESLWQGIFSTNHTRGTLISCIKSIWNQFHSESKCSVLGYEMKINSNGDAERNYSLFGLCQRTVGRASVGSQWVQSNAIKSLEKNVTYGLCPVGSFGQSSSVATILLTDDIVWSDGAVPRSTPRCGFRGELCTESVGYSLHSGEIALATTGLLVLISVIFIVGYRSYKYEKVCASLEI